MAKAAEVEPEIPTEILTQLRKVCLGLPEAYEEPAWIGTRWRIRKRTFAHVLTVDADHPRAFARAADADGPLCVMTFRSSGPELDVLTKMGPPFFKPDWGANVVGLVIEPDVDWDEVAELLTESYCVMAPKKLAERVQGLAG